MISDDDWSWDYRFVARKDGTIALHEVYYLHDRPLTISDEPSQFFGEAGIEPLIAALELAMQGIGKGILREDDLMLDEKDEELVAHAKQNQGGNKSAHSLDKQIECWVRFGELKRLAANEP